MVSAHWKIRIEFVCLSQILINISRSGASAVEPDGLRIMVTQRDGVGNMVGVEDIIPFAGYFVMIIIVKIDEVANM